MLRVLSITNHTDMKLFVVLAAFFAAVQSDKLIHPLEVPEQNENIPIPLFSHGKDKGLVQDNNFKSRGEDPINDKDITFYVYTQANVNKSDIIRASQVKDLLKVTGFSTSRDTLIIAHGWFNNFESPPNALIRPAALSDRDINVIAVDWSPIAYNDYTVAQAAVENIGYFVGDFLNKLVDVHGYDLNRITFVGHSLGAHLAGCAGARTKGKLNTIVGLDPAGNYPYDANNKDNRLDATDAQFVQVIVSSYMAPTFPMGHTNYYPNGGLIQPGCVVDPLGTCSHNRAVEYYAESLTSNKFRALNCLNWLAYQMGMCLPSGESYMGGLPVKKAASGSYFLATNSNAPFARG